MFLAFLVPKYSIVLHFPVNKNASTRYSLVSSVLAQLRQTTKLSISGKRAINVRVFLGTTYCSYCISWILLFYGYYTEARYIDINYYIIRRKNMARVSITSSLQIEEHLDGSIDLI